MTESPGPPPQEAPRKASRARIITMMILGGVVLAVGGCALFLANANFSTGGADNPLSVLGGLGFAAGVIAFIGGIIWALVRWIDRRFAKGKAQ